MSGTMERAGPPRRAKFLGAVALLVLSLPAGGLAQAPTPLTKTELVRLLSSGTYSPPELAELVRRNCLTFEPTARDRADLVSLGAGEGVLAAIDSCRQEPLFISLSSDFLTVPAGGTGWVQARARKGSRPVPGLRLQLNGIPAAGGNAVVGVTDARGEAGLSFPVGRTARTFRVPVVVEGAGSDEIESSPTLTVRVVPGAPVTARLSPASLSIDPGRDTVATVRAEVRDGFGNPVVGQSVSLTEREGGARIGSGETDEEGTAEMRAEISRLTSSGVLTLRAGARVLGEMAVEVDEAVRETAAPGTEPEGSKAAAPGSIETDPEDRAQEPGSVESKPEGEPGAPSRGVSGQPGTEPSGQPEGEAVPSAASDLGESRPGAEPSLDSLTSYRDAVARSPDDSELRLAFARELERSGRLADAERQYVEILRRTPGNRHVRASRGLALLRTRPYRFEVEAFGGATLESTAGVRAAEVSVSPARELRIWGRYDRSLGLEPLPLLRSPDETDGFFGGAEVQWGPERRLATSVELGRRILENVPLEPGDLREDSGDSASADLSQNVIRAEQSVLVPVGGSFASVAVGGYLGRWFDRDDWLLYARGGIRLEGGLAFAPTLYVGSTTEASARPSGRSSDREVRIYLPVTYRTLSGWLLEPGAAIGRVTSDLEDRSGTLYEFRLLLEAPLAGPHRVRLFARHQSPPGAPSYTVLAAGLRLRIQ